MLTGVKVMDAMVSHDEEQIEKATET